MENITFEYPELIESLKNGEKFSLARYGDGEFFCMLGKPGQNTDQHKYYPDLGKALRNILLSKPRYHIGLQPLAKRDLGERPDFQELVSMNDWDSDTEMLVKASVKDGLKEFTDVVSQRHIILVGNKHLRQYPHSDFVEIPLFNCWKSYQRVVDEISFLYTDESVILYCASMMSEVIIDLFDGVCTQIDVGSAIDPYVGRRTRRYHKHLRI